MKAPTQPPTFNDLINDLLRRKCHAVRRWTYEHPGAMWVEVPVEAGAEVYAFCNDDGQALFTLKRCDELGENHWIIMSRFGDQIVIGHTPKGATRELRRIFKLTYHDLPSDFVDDLDG